MRIDKEFDYWQQNTEIRSRRRREKKTLENVRPIEYFDKNLKAQPRSHSHGIGIISASK